MEIEKAAGVARRGAYVRRSPELKAAIVAECLVPGASVAAVALAHGVNANLVRKWIEKSRPSIQAETDLGWLAVVPDTPPPAGARQDSCRLNHAALCCLASMATTASRSGLRVTTVIGDQSRVFPVQRAG